MCKFYNFAVIPKTVTICLRTLKKNLKKSLHQVPWDEGTRWDEAESKKPPASRSIFAGKSVDETRRWRGAKSRLTLLRVSQVCDKTKADSLQGRRGRDSPSRFARANLSLHEDESDRCFASSLVRSFVREGDVSRDECGWFGLDGQFDRALDSKRPHRT